MTRSQRDVEPALVQPRASAPRVDAAGALRDFEMVHRQDREAGQSTAAVQALVCLRPGARGGRDT